MVTVPSTFYASGTMQDTQNIQFQETAQKEAKAEAKKSKKQQCEEKGGFWDEATQTCILKPKEEIVSQSDKTPTAPPLPGSIETFTNESGRASGVVLPDGRTFLGLSPDDVNLIAEGEAARVARPSNSAPVGTAQRQLELQSQLQELGNVAGISQTELNSLIEQYNLTGRGQFKEGFPGAIREAIPGALQTGVTTGLGAALVGAVGTGATAGTIGGPVGVAIGAAAGIVFGLWRGLAKAKKSEAKEDVTNAMSEFTQLRKGMTQVATLASSGYINAEEAVMLYNAQYSRMLEIEAQVKYLQDTNLKDYLSDGSDDLAQIQTYINQVVPSYEARIKTSFLNPMAKIPYSDIVLQDMQSLEE